MKVLLNVGFIKNKKKKKKNYENNKNFHFHQKIVLMNVKKNTYSFGNLTPETLYGEIMHRLC